LASLLLIDLAMTVMLVLLSPFSATPFTTPALTGFGGCVLAAPTKANPVCFGSIRIDALRRCCLC
jgi:hypothetical protein